MNEQISALIDDEMHVADAAHLITSIQSSSAAADVWSQYHLIGDVMRGTNALNADFKRNLMHKLEQEPTVLSPQSMPQSLPQSMQDNETEAVEHSRRLPAVWSIAASFAAVMVVGWVALQQQTQTVPVLVATSATQSTVAEAVIPAEYLKAHQTTAPSGSAYYIQSVSYAE